MITNYHTHTRWCRHGEGEIEDYIRCAVSNGLKELAITEHVPHDNTDTRRMHLNEFDTFNQELTGLIALYADDIRVIKGFECEYYPDRLDFYREMRSRYGYDLLILGHHTTMDRKTDHFALTEAWQVRQYADEVVQGIRTGLFSFLAHPDVILSGYGVVDDAVTEAMDRIFAVCRETGTPVEINCNGQRYARGYPCWPLWERARGLDCLINSDAHLVPDLVDESVFLCERKAAELGLTIREIL